VLETVATHAIGDAAQPASEQNANGDVVVGEASEASRRGSVLMQGAVPGQQDPAADSQGGPVHHGNETAAELSATDDEQPAPPVPGRDNNSSGEEREEREGDAAELGQ
jgi:hypothetical protein